MSVSRSPRSVASITHARRYNLITPLQTKKKRSSRKQAQLSDIIADDDQMQVDEKPIVPRQRNLDDNFVDDDELQAALARSRQAKLQKRKKLSPEELAKKSKLYFLP